MLLFTTPSVDDDLSGWAESASFVGDGLVIEARLDAGRHVVSVRAADNEHHHMAEAVCPVALGSDDEAVSSFHLPPFYRWEQGGFSCEFTAEWRDGPSSLGASMRHMQSLRPHPRSLIVEAEDGSVRSAIVIGKQAEWRGWHVIDIDDAFDGPNRRILATHTSIRGQVSPTST